MSSEVTAAQREGQPALRVVGPHAYADWEAFYRDNAVRVYQLLFRRVGNAPDAEDLAEEVMLRTLQRELEPARRRRLVSRRALLGAAGSAVAAAAAGGLAGYGLGVRPRPAPPAALAPDGARWIVAARLADLAPGTARPFATGSMRLMLVNDGGRIRALLRHGLPQAPPALPAASVRVVDGRVEVLAI